MSSLAKQRSKPSQPKNTLRELKFPDVRNSNSGQRMAGESSQMESVGSEAPTDSSQSSASKLKNSVKEKMKNLARFGPTYWEVDAAANGQAKEDVSANEQAKCEAWKAIKSYGSLMRSIGDMEKKVMDCYDSSITEKLKRRPKEFREMMARDGCFFLQLALHILGAGDHLGYPDENAYFGKSDSSGSLIPDMFIVGNQIPCLVINALMEHPFFQNVIEEGIKKDTWKRRPVEDLAKLALYQTIVEPHVEKNKKMMMKMKMKKMLNKIILFLLRKQPPLQDPPSHILEALRNLHLGSDNDPSHSDMKDFQDLEAGIDGKDKSIPGAGELYKQGIKLVKGKTGITNIRFKNMGYAAFLYVPPFTVDEHTKYLLTSLANWELNLNESERELTSYLRFMRDLSRTYQDFKILERKGIIRVKEEELKGTMVHMLDAIISTHNSNYTLKFRQIRRKIKDYGGPPWRFISFCLGIFTVVQTIFTVLSYCFPPRA